MHDDNFSPDNIERLPDASSREDARLMSDLQAAYQPLAESHTRSLQRVRARLAQREVPGRSQSPIVQSQKQPILLAAEWNQPEEKMGTIKEKEAMEENNLSRGMGSSMPLSQTKKRNSFLRVVSLSLVAAVAIITILSFTLFSGILRSGHQTAGKQPSSITGAQPQQSQQPQKALSNGKLVCSVGLDVRADPPFSLTSADVSWSAQGKVAALSLQNFTIFSAKDCSAKSTSSATIFYEQSWSPDGTKLVTASSSIYALNVLDSHGNSIKNIPFTQLGAISVGPLTWSSDSTRLIFQSIESNNKSSIKSVDAATGGNVKTLMTVPSGGSVLLFSPGGKYVVLLLNDSSTMQQGKGHSVWDVNTGKKMSDLPPDKGNGDASEFAFSPDGSQFAQGGNGKIHIYGTADGKLLSSFANNNGRVGMDNLVWSPDGKYLAWSATSINIYDVNAGKIVTTFGNVDAHHEIFNLAWAPDSTGLVSSTGLVPDDGHSQTIVNVWALS